jgi:hypothetical protein
VVQAHRSAVHGLGQRVVVQAPLHERECLRVRAGDLQPGGLVVQRLQLQRAQLLARGVQPVGEVGRVVVFVAGQQRRRISQLERGAEVECAELLQVASNARAQRDDLVAFDQVGAALAQPVQQLAHVGTCTGLARPGPQQPGEAVLRRGALQRQVGQHGGRHAVEPAFALRRVQPRLAEQRQAQHRGVTAASRRCSDHASRSEPASPQPNRHRRIS